MTTSVRYMGYDPGTGETRFAVMGDAGKVLPPGPMAALFERALLVVDPEDDGAVLCGGCGESLVPELDEWAVSENGEDCHSGCVER